MGVGDRDRLAGTHGEPVRWKLQAVFLPLVILIIHLLSIKAYRLKS